MKTITLRHAPTLYLQMFAASIIFFVIAFMFVQGARATTIGTNITTEGTFTLTSTTNPQMTVRYDSADYLQTSVSATGGVTFNSAGSELARSFTFSDPMHIATSTTESILTVESINTSNASTTLAVYQFGTGNIFDVFDGATNVFTVRDGGKAGVGSTTPWALLSVEASGSGSSFAVGSSTATIFEIKSTGVVHGNDQAKSYIDFVWEGTSLNNLFVIDASANRVGIATTTPNAMLSVGNNAGGGSATSTLDFGKSCYHAYTDTGSEFWWYFTGATGSSLSIATSTEDCNNS